MLTFGVVLLYDNARSRTSTAARTRVLLEDFNWELFDHPPYRPDLPPSNYHLFTYLKNCMGSQRFNDNGESMEGVKTWLSSQEADFFDTDIQKLIPFLHCFLRSQIIGGYFPNIPRNCIISAFGSNSEVSWKNSKFAGSTSRINSMDSRSHDESHG
jgi:transposase